MPLLGLRGDLVLVQGTGSSRSHKGVLSETWVAACFPAGARCFSKPFVQVAAAATETTQPAKERNSCVQLTALRLMALLLPWRLSLAEQWQLAGWLSPETGAAASGAGKCESSSCQGTRLSPEAAQGWDAFNLLIRKQRA